MSDKILLVDDDANLLDSYRRQLRKQFQVFTAQGGPAALEELKREGPFAVIVADMRMPEMDGIELLRRVRETQPDTVRVMLTGNADLTTSIQAVNEGSVFQFLTKPCPAEQLVATLRAGLEQHHLIHLERGLLEETLRGSVHVLTEILSLVNPLAFSRANRIKRYVSHMVARLKLPNAWQYELAAMLSQIGCVALPSEVLTKVYRGRELSYREDRMWNTHPGVAARLLASIPRLEVVARMVGDQMRRFEDFPPLGSAEAEGVMAALGAQILKLALDYDRLMIRAVSRDAALHGLARRAGEYNPRLLQALEDFEDNQIEVTYREISVAELKMGMVTDEPIKSKRGLLLVPAGHEVTYTVLERVRNFYQGHVGVKEPIRVRFPAEDAVPV